MPSEMLATLNKIKSGDHVSERKLRDNDAFRNAACLYVNALMEENLEGLSGKCDESSYRVDKSAYSCVRSIRKHRVQLEYMRLLQEYYPEAKKILILRDPRDVIVSYSEWKGQRTGPLLNTTPRSLYYFIRHVRNWHKLNMQWLDDSKKDKNCLVVRYEDMKNKFEDVIKEVFGFIGIPVDEKYLEYLKENYYRIDSEKYKKENLDRGYGFFRKGELGEWKTKFKWYHRVIYKFFSGDKSEFYS